MHSTARTGLILRLDDDLFPRQMGRQRTTIDRALTFTRRFKRRVHDLILRSIFRNRLLGFLHPQAELIRIELFGFAVELYALQLAQRLPQPRIVVPRSDRTKGG